VAGPTISYEPQDRFLGIDAFTYELTAGGLTSRYTTEVEVTRIETCHVQADCAGGDTCENGVCVQPTAAESGGCGCTSSGQGASTALLGLLLLALLGRRRPRPSAAGREG
jgi:MYXO-CTERM domain-containing protein